MARSTGPILAVGAITLTNQVILNNKPMNWKIPVATGFAVAVFSVIEKGWEQGAVALSWMALITILISRTDPAEKSPVENLLDWIG